MLNWALPPAQESSQLLVICSLAALSCSRRPFGDRREWIRCGSATDGSRTRSCTSGESQLEQLGWSTWWPPLFGLQLVLRIRASRLAQSCTSRCFMTFECMLPPVWHLLPAISRLRSHLRVFKVARCLGRSLSCAMCFGRASWVTPSLKTIVNSDLSATWNILSLHLLQHWSIACRALLGSYCHRPFEGILKK